MATSEMKILLVSAAVGGRDFLANKHLRTDYRVVNDIGEVPRDVVGIQVIHDNGEQRIALVWWVVPGDEADALAAQFEKTIDRQISGEVGHDPRGVPLAGSISLVPGWVYGTEPADITARIRPSRTKDVTRVSPEELDDHLLGQNDESAAIEAVINPRRRGRQRLSAAENRAIEMHAVEVTQAHFEERGYVTEDVGATQSYDIRATKGADVIKIEVKGTTSNGSEVVLTANEVDLHRNSHPHNAFALVRRIVLERDSDAPAATGGELTLVMPWEISDEQLKPLAYRFQTGL
jgi:hypothetical protein